VDDFALKQSSASSKVQETVLEEQIRQQRRKILKGIASGLGSVCLLVAVIVGGFFVYRTYVIPPSPTPEEKPTQVAQNTSETSLLSEGEGQQGPEGVSQKEEKIADTAPDSEVLIVSVSDPYLKRFAREGTVGLYFSVADKRGQPVDRLGPEDVEVWEDEKKVKLVDFRGEEQGKPVDIVVVFDITESMQPFIDGMKEATIDFADRLAKANRDYRLGLVTFEDYVIRDETAFTRSAREFKSWVGALQASGGGDIPEDSLDGLVVASRFPFRPEAQAVVILITDAPNHFRGDGSDKTYGHEVTQQTADAVIADLKKANLSVFAIAPAPFTAPDLHKIAKETGGRHYNILSEGRRFPELIKEIGRSLASQHFLTYQSPRPVEVGTRRQITLKVTYQNREGAVQVVYQVPSKESNKASAEEAERLALIQERSKKPLELVTVRFLNTGKDGKRLSGPADAFAASQLRFVAWEAVFSNRLSGLTPAYHRVEATYYAPDGQSLGTVQDAKEVAAESKEVTFTGRLGNASGGAFALGTYRVDFYVNGWPLSSKTFTVDDDRNATPLLRHHVGSMIGLVARREVPLEINFRPQGDGGLRGDLIIHEPGYSVAQLEGRLDGNQIEFRSSIGPKTYHFQGWRDGDRLSGTYRVSPSGGKGQWSVKIIGGPPS
jgi:Mg-chelatase subunit ChlD